MPSKKLLFIIENLGHGGAQRVITTLLRHFPRGGHEFHLCLLTGEGPFLGDVAPDVHLHRLGATRMLLALPALARLIRRLRPASIFSTVLAADALTWAACRMSGHRPRIVFRCCTFPTSGLAILAPHLRVLIPFAYRRADAVIATTGPMRADLTARFGVKPERIRLIWNPLDLGKVKAQAGTPSGFAGPFFCAMGRLIFDKGFDLLLEAFARMGDSQPGARLVILGEGPLKKDLADSAARLGIADRVLFPGFIQDPWAIIRSARAFVLPSRREGFPNALVEAMALGVPCVAANCNSGPAEVLEDGVTGLLVPVNDADALAKAMRRILAEPELALAMSGRARAAAANFDPPRIAQSVLEVMDGAA